MADVPEKKPNLPECEVVLTPEEYDDFQAMLARPPRAVPALVRLLRLRRLGKEPENHDDSA